MSNLEGKDDVISEEDILQRRGHYVNTASQCLSAGNRLENFPGLLMQMIEMDAWRDFIVPRVSRRRQFRSFREFLEANPPDGFGTTLDVVTKICSFYHADNVLLAIKKLDAERGGNNPEGSNQHKRLVETRGACFNQKEYKPGAIHSTATPSVLLRLEKQRPDLLDRVLSKEMTPHAAAIEAGFRKTEYRLPKDPAEAGRYLASRVDTDWLEAMLAAYKENS